MWGAAYCEDESHFCADGTTLLPPCEEEGSEGSADGDDEAGGGNHRGPRGPKAFHHYYEYVGKYLPMVIGVSPLLRSTVLTNGRPQNFVRLATTIGKYCGSKGSTVDRK
jgi:hypothetical protein